MNTPALSPDWPAGVERATPALIARYPGAPASFRATALACLNIKEGGFIMRLPDGRALAFGDPASPLRAEMHVKTMRFGVRVLTNGDIGFAEGYMAGDWDTPDLSALLTLFSSNVERIVRVFRGNPLSQIAGLMRHMARDNTRGGARRNILAHYDLGNRFYQRWLDPTMTYSAARFAGPGEDLSAAQLNKYRAIAATMDLKPGEHVLEIGCGWGGFAEVAAREYGARVTGLTLSDAQLNFAQERMQRLGLNDQVNVRLQDYRDVQGSFDKVASIEMFEAVGERHWPAYFGKISDVLKPGGRAGLQIITIRDDLFEDYRKRADFIQRYIFPGGMLPSVERLEAEVRRANLAPEAPQAFGQSYARTLAEWGQRFQAAWGDIQQLGFDERFRRLWTFYLSYCEAGFRSGRTDVVQIGLRKT